MLMFVMHIAVAASIIALVMALGFVKCCKEKCSTEGKHSTGCMWLGWILVIIATLSLLCTLHGSYMVWQSGGMQVDIMIMDDISNQASQ